MIIQLHIYIYVYIYIYIYNYMYCSDIMNSNTATEYQYNNVLLVKLYCNKSIVYLYINVYNLYII